MEAVGVRKLVRGAFAGGLLLGSSGGAWAIARLRNVQLRGWLEIELGLGALFVIAVVARRLGSLRDQPSGPRGGA
jgi:hypothetical protein